MCNVSCQKYFKAQPSEIVAAGSDEVKYFLSARLARR
jgi:hypothetical protein